MKARLSKDQKYLLAEFCNNFAVAWLAAGVIVPSLTAKTLSEFSVPALQSAYWATILLFFMLYLTREKKGRK
jgi:hypothetical protein